VADANIHPNEVQYKVTFTLKINMSPVSQTTKLVFQRAKQKKYATRGR